jgi:hypothetical protein
MIIILTLFYIIQEGLGITAINQTLFIVLNFSSTSLFLIVHWSYMPLST